jgi:hypothetical protein
MCIRINALHTSSNGLASIRAGSERDLGHEIELGHEIPAKLE